MSPVRRMWPTAYNVFLAPMFIRNTVLLPETNSSSSERNMLWYTGYVQGSCFVNCICIQVLRKAHSKLSLKTKTSTITKKTFPGSFPESLTLLIQTHATLEIVTPRSELTSMLPSCFHFSRGGCRRLSSLKADSCISKLQSIEENKELIHPASSLLLSN